MIDDEIRDALKIDPSPEFLARVRTRIAEEPEPSAWRWSWLLGASAIAATIVIAVVMSKPEPKIATVPDATLAPVAQPFRAAIDDAAPKPLVAQGFSPAVASRRPDRSAKAVALQAPAETVARAAAPEEILIDPRERQALLRLITGVRDGRVDLSAARESEPHPPMELAPVTDIVIDLITIDPLAPVSGAEGARQ